MDGTHPCSGNGSYRFAVRGMNAADSFVIAKTGHQGHANMSKHEQRSGAYITHRPEPPQRNHGAPSRVLLAEDDPDMQELVRNALVKDGYEVICADDGLEMLERLGDVLELPFKMPDVIVMDFVMPRYSGLGVLSALRRANWSTPVIMMSAAADDSICEKARALGAAAFLRKPFDMDDLRAAVVNAAVLGNRVNPDKGSG